MQVAASGQRYVVSVFLQDLASARKPPEAADVNAFAQRVAVSQALRDQVRAVLAADDTRPEVIGQFLGLRGNGRLTVRGRVENTGPNQTDDFVVRLYVRTTRCSTMATRWSAPPRSATTTSTSRTRTNNLLQQRIY